MSRMLSDIDWQKIGKPRVAKVTHPQRPIIPSAVQSKQPTAAAPRASATQVITENGPAEKPVSQNRKVQMENIQTKTQASAGRKATQTEKVEKLRASIADSPDRDLKSGMETLDLNFMLAKVEDTDANNENDIVIRTLNFYELARTDQLDKLDSGALKVYAYDLENQFGKDIQCHAIKELARRTAKNL